MKRAWFLALVAIGCGPKTETVPVREDTSEKPVATNPGATNPITGAPDPGIKPKPEDASKPSDRLYPLSDLQTAELKTSGQKLTVWIMDDSSKRQEGMMFLRNDDVGPQQGMLFVFADSAPRSFWMRNTLIPLDIVYIDEKGKVINVVRGEPQDLNQLPSDRPAKYVIETEAGEAGKLGLKPGATVDGLLKIPGKP